MPTSTYSQIPALITFLERLMPSSILDVGLGNGKLGFIARDLLDVMHGERYRQEEWQIRIDGIEAFPDYVQAHQRAIYDDILIGDAFEVIDRVGLYDVILLGDVLEHLEKTRAEAFLDKCCAHCKQGIILSIPLSERWTQADIYGNPYERHLSFWKLEELETRVTEFRLLEFAGVGQYGTFLIRREDYLHYQARRRADTLAGEGQQATAVAALEGALDTLPPHLNTVLQLAELLVRQGAIESALHWLRVGQSHFPEEPSLRSFITKLSQQVQLLDELVQKLPNARLPRSCGISLDQTRECLQGASCPSGDSRTRRGCCRGFKQAILPLLGEGLQPILRGGSDAPPRVIHHSREGHEIPRIRDQAKVAQDVLDFAPLVESDAPHDLIRNPGTTESVLQST